MDYRRGTKFPQMFSEEQPVNGADYKCNRKLQRVVSRLQAWPEAGVIDRGLRKLLVISAAVTPS